MSDINAALRGRIDKLERGLAELTSIVRRLNGADEVRSGRVLDEEAIKRSAEATQRSHAYDGGAGLREH